MKRIYTITLAAVGAAMTLSAQSKFDMPAAMLVDNARQNTIAKAKSRAGIEVRTLAPEVDPAVKVLVAIILTDTSCVSDMQAKGFDLVSTEGDVILARLTPSQMEEAAAMDGVLQVSLGNEVYPMLKQARAVTGVDAIHNGSDELDGHSYTGNGVIVGMMDTGLDHNHLNFQEDDGDLRITRIWEITSGGTTNLFDTPDKIRNKRTDTSNGTHATHVLGIMGGSYNGTAKYADYNRIGRPSILNGKNPYYGVAKGSELSVCIGTLQNNNIQLAAQYLYDYAKQQNKPVVMNLSLGNTLGSHDGTDAGSRLLANLGKDMLICISAGNEGGYPLSLEKKLTASDRTVKTILSSGAVRKGSLVEIWGDNASAIKLTFAAVNKSTGAIVKEIYSISSNTQGKRSYVGGNSYSNYSDVTVNADMNRYFGSGALFGGSSNISTTNNRYTLNIQIECGIQDAEIAPALIIEGSAGNTINAYCNTTLGGFHSLGLNGYTAGNAANCINGMACGDNVLVVGSYANRIKWPTLSSGEIAFSGNPVEGDISDFSSSGWTYSGRKLPDVVGPGQGMIASYSTPYMQKLQNGELPQEGVSFNQRCAEATNPVTKEANYWMEMSGTSMSSPFVAGVLALWLEADPTLTMDRVKEIIRKTADHDEFTAKNPDKWGMGKINALAGLKEILGTGSVNTVEADDAADKMIIESLGGKRYSVFVGGTDGFTVNLYNLQGAIVATAATNGDTAEIDASAFADGIYLLEVTGKNLHASRKFVVK